MGWPSEMTRKLFHDPRHLHDRAEETRRVAVQPRQRAKARGPNGAASSVRPWTPGASAVQAAASCGSLCWCDRPCPAIRQRLAAHPGHGSTSDALLNVPGRLPRTLLRGSIARSAFIDILLLVTTANVGWDLRYTRVVFLMRTISSL
jgi:hypothetical protein